MAKKAAPAKAAKKPAAKKAAPAKAAASKTATTVTLKHLAAELAPAHELSKKQAEGVLTGMIDLMVKNLKKGQRIRLVGLGILQVRKRAPHGPQPGHRRSDQDQGEQEGRLPRRQGAEGSDLRSSFSPA